MILLQNPPDISPVIETAKAISDYGFMVVTSAVFLIVVFIFLRYFLKMFRDMFEKQQSIFELFQQNILEKLQGAYIYETPMEQIRVVQSALFDLSKYVLLDQLENIYSENNLKDEYHVRKKVLDVIINMHNDRKSKLDCFKYHGYSLASFTDKEWIKKVEAVCMRQLYLNEDSFDVKQAFNAIDIVYNYIKIEFYNNILTKS